MNKPEWIPKYPCGKCVDEKTCNSVAYCPLMAQYDSSLNSQIKLLEYQLAKAKAMKVGTVRTELGLWIESMLEQLGENNENNS